jgi:hypothetical protein
LPKDELIEDNKQLTKLIKTTEEFFNGLFDQEKING